MVIASTTSTFSSLPRSTRSTSIVLSSTATKAPLRTIVLFIITTFIWPSGTMNKVVPCCAAASSLYGMPPTGPILPSGLIIPVITTSSMSCQSSISAMAAIVSAAPAEGPLMMGEVTSIMK